MKWTHEVYVYTLGVWVILYVYVRLFAMWVQEEAMEPEGIGAPELALQARVLSFGRAVALIPELVQPWPCFLRAFISMVFRSLLSCCSFYDVKPYILFLPF